MTITRDMLIDWAEMAPSAFGRAMAQLHYLEHKIIKLRYGIGYGYTYTLEEVGRIFKVTRERARQLEVKALRKLLPRMRQEVNRE